MTFDNTALPGNYPVAVLSVAMSGAGHCARPMVHVVSCGRQQAPACTYASSCAGALVLCNLVQGRGVVCRACDISCSAYKLFVYSMAAKQNVHSSFHPAQKCGCRTAHLKTYGYRALATQLTL